MIMMIMLMHDPVNLSCLLKILYEYCFKLKLTLLHISLSYLNFENVIKNNLAVVVLKQFCAGTFEKVIWEQVHRVKIRVIKSLIEIRTKGMDISAIGVGCFFVGITPGVKQKKK